MTETTVDPYEERLAKLRERAEHRPQGWRFDDNGREFSGYFQRWEIARGAGYEGRDVPLALFLDRAGVEWAVWCFHNVLTGELVKVDPAAGELVLILYQGKVDPDGGGAAYHSYRVAVDRAVSGGGGADVDEVALLAGIDRLSRTYGDDVPAVPTHAEQPPPLSDDDIPY